MSDVLKHRFVSPHTDGADLTQVQPSSWNDGHKFIGGAEGDVLTRTLGDPTFGAGWVARSAIAVPPTYGVWTPVDASGAGLIFQSGTEATYAKFDRLVWIWAQVIYPATSNGAGALIGGVPFVPRGHAGAVQHEGVFRQWVLPVGQPILQPKDLTSGLWQSNTTLSGATVVFSGTYVTD